MIRLIKVDYRDGLGGAMYYMFNPGTNKREHITKAVFDLILAEPWHVVENVYPWEQCETTEYSLTICK